MISPVFNEPMLMIENDLRILVVADLHLGLEYELWQAGFSIPSQTDKILGRLKRYLVEMEPDTLVLLGDIKHNVPRTSWQEHTEIPGFLRELSRMVKVEVVPGNHDGGLADMAPSEVTVRQSSGFVLDGVGYFHGHTWPARSILDAANLLVAAHLHPVIRLKDLPGHSFTRRVWAKAPLLPEALEKQFGFHSDAEMIITPAFNDLCGGLPLNEHCEERRGPIGSLIDLDGARIYLLDGTDLGALQKIKSCKIDG